jgi:tellurite resistance protein
VPRVPPKIPLNLFSIPFGLIGLADCWLVAAGFGLAPVTLGRVLVAIAVAAWIVVLTAYARGARAHRTPPASELADPVAGPFAALIVITPMLAGADGLYPLDHTAGTVVVDIGITLTLLLGGWLTGEWIYKPLALDKIHPGYFLPSVAGGLVAAVSSADVGQTHLAWLLFGVGILSWIVLGSIILTRLFIGSPLPTPLIPTLAIEVAPAAVATFAWFSLNGPRIDAVVRLLAGYGLLMVVVQVRLMPGYLRLRFMPSFWAFTFSWAAVAFAGLTWLGVSHPAAWRVESYVALALISVLVGGIAARTALALGRRQLLPVAAPLTAPEPGGR